MTKKLQNFKKNILLCRYTTFKIGGPARYFYIAKSREDLIKAIKMAKDLKLPFLILGGGSNVLFPDRGYDGLVIKCQMSTFKYQTNKIYAQSGTKLKDLVNLSLRKSLSGLEWAAGIPGTIGGAIFGNAGAFGSAIEDIIESVEVFDAKNFKTKKIPVKSCKFSNKESFFKKKRELIIISAVFKLKNGSKKEIKKKINANLNYRMKNHPLIFPSVGCVFKNYNLKIKNKKLLKKFPELNKFNRNGSIPAAYLIDKCGLKGKRIGRTQISAKHANFIVNLGRGKAREVKQLMELIKQKVKRKFGIILEEEIQIIS